MISKVLFAYLFLVIAVAAAASVAAFSSPSVSFRRNSYHNPDAITAMHMGLFDFEPFHGGGSDKEKLDELWEAQQALLRQRRGQNDKDSLKKKYTGKKTDDAAAATAKAKKDAASTAAEQKPDSKGFFWEK